MIRTLFVAFVIALSMTCYSCSARRVDPAFASWSYQLNWTKIPILVYDDADIEFFGAALGMWNKKGCQVFAQTYSKGNADIIVIRSEDQNAKTKQGKRRAGSFNKESIITLYVAGNAGWDFGILVHELGHALGLKHDYKLEYSIMKPGISSRYKGVSRRYPAPTNSDLKAVRKKYCTRR